MLSFKSATARSETNTSEGLTPQLLHPHPLQLPPQDEQLVHAHGPILIDLSGGLGRIGNGLGTRLTGLEDLDGGGDGEIGRA